MNKLHRYEAENEHLFEEGVVTLRDLRVVLEVMSSELPKYKLLSVTCFNYPRVLFLVTDGKFHRITAGPLPSFCKNS